MLKVRIVIDVEDPGVELSYDAMWYAASLLGMFEEQAANYAERKIHGMRGKLQNTGNEVIGSYEIFVEQSSA